MTYQQQQPSLVKPIQQSRSQLGIGQQGIAGQPQMGQQLPLQQAVVGQPTQYPLQRGSTPPSPVQPPALVQAQPAAQQRIAQPTPPLQPTQQPLTQQAVQTGGTSASTGPYALTYQQPPPVQPTPAQPSIQEPTFQQPVLIQPQPGQAQRPQPVAQQPVLQPIQQSPLQPSFYQSPPQPIQHQPVRQAHRPLHQQVVRQPVQQNLAQRQPARRITVRDHADREAEGAIDYSEVVDGTVEEVKERVVARAIDAERVLEAERAGEARVTLIGWLESLREED